MGERSELEDQDDEDKQDRSQQYLRKSQKALALDLVEAAKLDIGSWWELNFFEKPFSNLTHRRSQVATLKTSRHRGHIAQVLASDFGLALLHFHIRHTRKGNRGAGRGSD